MKKEGLKEINVEEINKDEKSENESKINLEREKKENELKEKFMRQLNINYSEFDSQKGTTSPRLLFKKRKIDDSYLMKKKENEDNYPMNIKMANKVKNSFENLLDFVHETYFMNDNNIPNEKENHYNFKFTSLDLLLNPLRQKFTWETWSPYEIALFYCCICKFGTNFQFYENIITTKTKEEIIDFYFSWKSSKYYKIWKSNKRKKNKRI
jgi:hypothetical protein